MILKKMRSYMGKFIDRTGMRFGRLVALQPERMMNNRVGWLCRCDCGVEKIVDAAALAIGNTSSCGKCVRKAAAQKYNGKNWIKHGEAGTPLHRCWSAMVRRVKYPRHYGPSYSGVTLADEWLDYVEFAKWARENGWVEGLTIDRIDNSKGYGPNNCRFATRAGQARNRTTTKLTAGVAAEIRRLEKEGGMSRKQIGARFGISDKTVSDLVLNKRWATTDSIVTV
jgi:hypothetical protein